MRTPSSTAIAGACLALAACGSASDVASARRAASGRHGFTSHVTNPWFPLSPGSVYRYRGTKDGKQAFEVLRVTHRVKLIQGAPTVVISDKLYLDGKLGEKTVDYYSQDRAGNVWYFGEDTVTLRPDGRVESREGTFRAGRNGARAGIYLTAHPRVGQSRQQEFYRGHAEDRFTVRSLRARVRTPFVSSRHALRTEERTRLEPRVLDEKFYVRGVGTVLENELKGPGSKERLTLVSFRRG